VREIVAAHENAAQITPLPLDRMVGCVGCGRLKSWGDSHGDQQQRRPRDVLTNPHAEGGCINRAVLDEDSGPTATINVFPIFRLPRASSAERQRLSSGRVLTRKHDPKSLFLECGLPRRSDFRRRVRRDDELASNHCLWAVPASQYRLALSGHEKLAVDDLLAAGGYPKRAQGRVVRHLAGREEHGLCQRGRHEARHYSNTCVGIEVRRALPRPLRYKRTANSARNTSEGSPRT
jgi:hypothetical protein